MVADRRVSLGLDDAVRRGEEIAREVSRSSVRANPVVAVVLPSSVETVTHLLAAILGDHTVSFLDPASGQRTDAVIDAVDPDVVVDATESTLAGPVPSRGRRCLGKRATSPCPRGRPERAPKEC